ncbi:hypothetical protein FB451DRAFT_1260950 [Mycena latifolia]|nr:hypothetical protein FB451DRAFT_1260950 [Mycena latifolia]
MALTQLAPRSLILTVLHPLHSPMLVVPAPPPRRAPIESHDVRFLHWMYPAARGMYKGPTTSPSPPPPRHSPSPTEGSGGTLVVSKLRSCA